MTEALIPAYSSDRDSRVYHSDHDCRTRPDKWIMRSLLWLADDAHDWQECEICVDGDQSHDSLDWSHQQALKEADSWDDLSLGGDGE